MKLNEALNELKKPNRTFDSRNASIDVNSRVRSTLDAPSRTPNVIRKNVTFAGRSNSVMGYSNHHLNNHSSVSHNIVTYAHNNYSPSIPLTPKLIARHNICNRKRV